MTNNLSFDFGGKIPSFKVKILKDIIIDRKSKYTAISVFVEKKEDVKDFLSELLKDKYFKEASHNSYAYRIKQENGSILEGKNDDLEEGAGMCILREIQRENFVNTLIIITRIFGGTLLFSDRFKNVIDATKIILKEIQKKS